MKDRTVELGGETLRAGKTVVVYERGTSEAREIARIGTANVHLKRGSREEAFRIKDRHKVEPSNGTGSFFRTHTEVARTEKRQALIARLRELGLRSTDSFGSEALERYPDGVLEKVIAVLIENTNSGD